MNKRGTVRKVEFSQYKDRLTNTTVTRLTPKEILCHRNYFYQKCFTEDGNKLVFGADFSGSRGDGGNKNWNYHLLDLRDQSVLQLTDGEAENTFGGFLSPDDQYLYFFRGSSELIRVTLDGKKEECIYRVSPGWVGYGTWVANSACTKMVGIEIAASDWFPLTDWKKFGEMFHKKPLCRLFYVDLKTGQSHTILEQRGWLGHPQYQPGCDDIVAYCHEGPHDLIDARMWFINEDGTNRRCGKVHAEAESCTHEFWVPDGSAMMYVSYNANSPDRWIRRIDGKTWKDELVMKMPPCSHLMSNHDGSMLVGDGCGKPEANSNDMTKGDPYLHLFDVKSNVSRPIACHGSSWGVYRENRQVTHPHPSFAPDQKNVLFSADGEGEPGLYLASLDA